MGKKVRKIGIFLQDSEQLLKQNNLKTSPTIVIWKIGLPPLYSFTFWPIGYSSHGILDFRH
jgi:hypothetical protein